MTTMTFQQVNPANRSTSLSSEPFSHDDQMARVFNTAMIATQAEENAEFSNELFQLMKSPAFQAILRAARDLSRAEGLPEKDAAETIIATFRKLDALWSKYVFREGVERIRSPQQRSISMRQ